MKSPLDETENPYRAPLDVDDADKNTNDPEDVLHGREWLLAAFLIATVTFGLFLSSCTLV